MSAEQIIAYSFASIGTLLVGIAWWIAGSLSKLTDGVERLNERLAGIVTRVESHELRIDFQDKRLDGLETKKKKRV